MKEDKTTYIEQLNRFLNKEDAESSMHRAWEPKSNLARDTKSVDEVSDVPTSAELVLVETVETTAAENGVLLATKALHRQHTQSEVEESESGLSIPAPRRILESNPGVAPEIRRLNGTGLDMLLKEDAFLRAVNLVDSQGARAREAEKWEYYFVTGDDAGPRIIQKLREQLNFREQKIVFLKGSSLQGSRLNAVLHGSKLIPWGAIYLRGNTHEYKLDDEELKVLFLCLHENQTPRPPQSPKKAPRRESTVSRLLKRVVRSTPPEDE
jgi:hypothetical protein